MKIYGGLSGFPWGNPAAVDQTKGGVDRGTQGDTRGHIRTHGDTWGHIGQ